MKKKITLIIISIIGVALFGTFFYYRLFQTAPEFTMPLIPEMKDFNKNDKILIISPHPDDETLAAAGLIQKALVQKAKIKVVFITNGDENRFSTMEEFKKIYPSADNYLQSGFKRQNEAKNALKILGVSEADIIFLGYPDRGLKNLIESHWLMPYKTPYTKKDYSPYYNSYQKNVSYTGENLTKNLAQIYHDFSPNIILGPNSSDTHTDHAAVAIFIQKMLKSQKNKPENYFYLIHYNRFPNPKGLKTNRFLTPPIKLISISNSWYKISLTSDQENLKKRAILQYQSQFSSPWLKKLMYGFIKKNELLSK